MSPDLLQVKEEAREADAAWQAAAALSDIAEALAEGHGEHDEGRDEGVETSEGAAASVLSEHDGHATAMDTSAEPSLSHDTPASAVDAMDATDEPKESDSDAAMAKANATKATEVSDDVAVRAAEALGRIGLIKLPERRPKAPKAGDPEADAIEAMEAAILAAETPAAPAAPAPAEAPPKTKTAVKAAPAAAKSRAQSKASVKDLRAKLDQCRDDKTAVSTASTASPATSAISGATSSATSAAKAASAMGPAAIAAAPAPGAGGKMPLGTASELRAKLLEAKQRLGVGVANGQSPITALPPPPEKKDKKEKKEGKEKKDEEDKDKKKKKDKKEKKREKEARQTPIPKQQALPLLCEEKDAKDSKEEAEKKVAIEQAKARRLEELREREAQKVQQVHSKAAARKKKEVEDSVRELARKLSQDILEISETINVENIKEEAVKREGRVGHFGVPGTMTNVKSEVKQETGAAGLARAQLASPSIADFVKSENVKSEMAQGMKSETGLPGLPPGLGPEQRQMIISPELYAQQMSQLKSMATPEAMALSASSSAATPHFDARLEAPKISKDLQSFDLLIFLLAKSLELLLC